MGRALTFRERRGVSRPGGLAYTRALATIPNSFGRHKWWTRNMGRTREKGWNGCRSDAQFIQSEMHTSAFQPNKHTSASTHTSASSHRSKSAQQQCNAQLFDFVRQNIADRQSGRRRAVDL